MKFNGRNIEQLSVMKPGNMYVFVENQGTNQKAWAFTFTQKDQIGEQFVYRGQLILNSEVPIVLSPEDQRYMNEGTSFLYTLEGL